MTAMQGELFGRATLVLRSALIGADGNPPFIVIGCGRSKQSKAALASDLYTSDRFRLSLDIARRLGAPYAILSGKHGVIDGETMLQPYDLNLPDLPPAEQRKWALSALDVLHRNAGGRRITLLAAPEYTSPLVEANETTAVQLEIVTPWAELQRADTGVWLVEAMRMATRIRDLARFYSWIESQREGGKAFAFRNLTSQPVPKRGVYIFLDRREPNFLGSRPRIVRIGTHAVSFGSKATLRGRLRNHLGPANEIGNHRGSIFRLHVGRAMLHETASTEMLPSWGLGQDADQETKALEVEHELAVSRYLQDLEVVLIDVDDEPRKDSLRAKVEAQLIALCSESMRPIDCPTVDWLGFKSPVASIRESGLWNIRGVGEKYDSTQPGSVQSIIGT
ncbi:hypothetical protein JQ591_12605 [Bradyrhizobium canariense]|nr:DUF6884 domain-containing protein [Bradyrhizobium canariense]MBR0951279.1 hypothetical protein [Bradyrhizobium canariense]